MLEEFLSNIAERNPYQVKYLQTAMKDITVKELQKLENIFNFYIKQGDNIESVTNKYLNLIDFIMEDQKYFLENGHYRYSSFKDVEELYKTSSYMESYVVGLGLSTYLWHVHRGMMRFFFEHCKRLTKGGKYLEIGPGHGEYFITAMENTDFDSYCAVDISETSVNITKSFCEYSLGNATNKNYQVLHKNFFDYTPKDKFDAVIMGEVLEHVENPKMFLEKIYDVANDDAFIYITTAINAPQPDHIYHFRTIDEVLDLFRNTKLGVVDQILLTANNVPIEKAINKEYAIVAGFVLSKGNDYTNLVETIKGV